MPAVVAASRDLVRFVNGPAVRLAMRTGNWNKDILPIDGLNQVPTTADH